MPARPIALILLVIATVHFGLAANTDAYEQVSYLKGACLTLKDRLSEFQLGAPKDPDCASEEMCIVVDWRIASEQRLTDTLALLRPTNELPVRVHTINVNRLHYSVRWKTEVEGQSQAYETLSSWFDSLLTPVSIVSGIELYGVGQSARKDWMTKIALAQRCIAETVATVSQVALDEDDRGRLHEVERLITYTANELSVLGAKALTEAESDPYREAMAEYWDIALRQSVLERQITDFLGRARASVEGVSTVMPVEGRNTIVRLTAQAFRHSGEAVGEPVSARYFVRSAHGVLYHIGYSFGRPQDIDFAAVRSASGTELFSATGDAAGNDAESKDSELVAFMSWEIARFGGPERFGAAVTLGTGITNPGESVYYGMTVRIFERLLITAGGVTAVVLRGEGQVEGVTAGIPSRTLFASIRDRRTSGFFASVSFEVH